MSEQDREEGRAGGADTPPETKAGKAAWRMSIPAGIDDAASRGTPGEVPLGWFTIARSSDVSVGVVKPIRCFARDLVLWRGEDGQARLLDARCPHNRVDMAHGGRVEGNWLQCPLHHWRWDETGTLKEIPYSQVPLRVRQNCQPKWPLREVDGRLWVWHHPRKEEPSWEPGCWSQASSEASLPGQSYEWMFATSVESLLHAALRIILRLRSRDSGARAAPAAPEQRIWAPIVLGNPEGSILLEICGAGEARLRCFGAAQLEFAMTATPVEHDRVHVRVHLGAARSGTDGARDDQAHCDAVKRLVRIIDRVKRACDRQLIYSHHLLPGEDASGLRAWFSRFHAPAD